MTTDKRYYGKYRGIVSQPIDPENNGKLTAMVTVGGVPMPVVAEACTPFGGANAAWFAMPPSGSGVWIEFEEGDIRKPVWTGCWWPEGQLALALQKATTLQTLPVVLQTMVGNRMILSSVPGDCITLETTAGALGPRIVISSVGIKLTVGKAAAVELGPDGVKINGTALTVKPPVTG